MKHLRNLIFLFLLFASLAEASVYRTQFLWRPGKTLDIVFTNGSEEEIFHFQRAARLWTRYANIKMRFRRSETIQDGDIRVQFKKGTGSHSVIGKGALMVYGATMNIGADVQEKNRFETTVLHEMGHALGLAHEHQHPGAGRTSREEYLANEAIMMRECASLYQKKVSEQWYAKNRTMCLHNLLPFDIESLEYGYTSFDVESIMFYDHYREERPSNLKTPEFGITLSLGDKMSISQIYPFEPPLSEEEILEMDLQDVLEKRRDIYKSLKTEKCEVIAKSDYPGGALTCEGDYVLKVENGSPWCGSHYNVFYKQLNDQKICGKALNSY